MRFRNDLDSGFADAVRGGFRRYLLEQREHRFGDAGLAAKGIGLGLILIAAYAGILLDPPHSVSFVLASIAGTAALLLAINIGHDAAHECLTRWRGMDHLLQRLTFTPLGIDAYLWRFRHTNSHHHFPNVNRCDIDIDQNVFFRLSPNQPHRWYFRWQHLYAPLVYCLVVTQAVFIQDLMYLYQRRIANLEDIRHSPSIYIAFYLSKIAFVILVFVLPAGLTSLSFWQVVVGYFAVSAIVSLLFVLLLIGTHFSDLVDFPNVGCDGYLPHSWAAHTLHTSQDWLPESPVANFLTGGANCHAAHHLFPRVSHRHYRALAPMIRENATRFGVRYTSASFSSMVASHFRFLRLMAAPPPHEKSNPSSAKIRDHVVVAKA